MIFVMQNWRKIPARVIPNVSDLWFVDDDVVWRIGYSKGVHTMPLDYFESQYTFAYIMGEAAEWKYGVRDFIKWLVWKHYLVSDLTQSAMNAHMRSNPI